MESSLWPDQASFIGKATNYLGLHVDRSHVSKIRYIYMQSCINPFHTCLALMGYIYKFVILVYIVSVWSKNWSYI